MKLQKFVANEIEKNIYFCIGTFKQIQLLSDKLLKEELSHDEFGSVKGLCLTEKNNILCCVITDNCPAKDYQHTLNHEIVHGVHYMLDYIGHGLEYDGGTEILAYYTSYYVKQGDKFLHELRKKKKKNK